MSLIVSDLPWPAQQQGAPIAADYLSGLRLVIDGGAQYPQALSFSQTDADGFRVLGTARVGGSGRGWSGATSTYVSARTTASNPSPLFEIPANSDWTAQFVIDGISGVSGTNYGFFRGGNTFVGSTFIVQDGTSRRAWVRVNGTDVLRPSSGAQWTTGQKLNLLVRFKNASRVEIWWDGRRQHSGTHSTSQDALLGTAGVHALLLQGANEITGGNLAAFRFWTRYLDDGQTEALANNEHALYEPLRIWVPVAAGASSTTIAAGVGTSDASGLPASIALTTTIAGGVGAAAASGLPAALALTTVIAGQVGAAAASGLPAAVVLSTSIAAGVGTAAASGLQAGISAGAGIAAGIGDAEASGLPASIALHTVIAAGVGSAAASGLAAAITPSTLISAGVGAAAASGLAAGVAETTIIDAGVGAAAASGPQAGISIGSGVAIGAGVGTATASGLQATIVTATVIAAGVGAAQAAGLGAQIVISTRVDAGVGAAAASGLDASISVVAGVLIDCGVGVAAASGLDCSIDVGTADFSDFYRYDVPARVLRFDIPGRSLRFDLGAAGLNIDA